MPTSSSAPDPRPSASTACPSQVAPAIEVRGLGKQYRLGSPLDAFDIGIGFRRLLGAPGRLARRLKGRAERRPRIWAVKDVDLDVRPGEVLGLIGPNGAGKSTLLKLLARITEPTEGGFVLRGRTAGLLQIGVGFHSEFTGRENVYFSGTVLGMRKREIDRRFDEIVAYAGLGEFIDTPAKRYSSGMFVRLAFAVAAHLEAEILLIDEVLAVGDADFRRRARETLLALARSGRTIVLVSHNMDTIREIATRVVLLEQGGVAAEGDPDTVVDDYLAR